MAIRTTNDRVKGILDRDYDAKRGTDLSPYVLAASTIVDRVVLMAAAKNITLTPQELEVLEAWVAAHCYQASDPAYASKSTGGASGSYLGKMGKGFEATRYGLMALRLDYSYCLENIDKKQRASAIWLGKPPSSQVPYVDRN